MKTLSFFVSLVIILTTLSFAPSAVADDTSEQTALTVFSEELADKVWPKLWLKNQLYWNLEYVPYSPNHDRLDDIKKEGKDAFLDAAEEVLEHQFEQLDIYVRLQRWFDHHSDIQLRIYRQESIEKETDSDITVDAGFLHEESPHHQTTFGLRIKSDPALYLRYYWFNDQTIKHDWSWHPLKSEIQYRINGEPLAFGLKAKYDYQDEQLKLSLEDWQVTRSLKFRLTTSYTFSDDEFEIQGLFYAAF